MKVSATKPLLYPSVAKSPSNGVVITLVKVYGNADNLKLDILLDNQGKSGIYMWKNLQDGQFYIGSARDLRRRLMGYFNINQLARTSNTYISRALLKYGYSTFSLTILEYCDLDSLIKREQHYIDTLKPEYNICRTAGSSLGRLHGELAKERVSDSKRGQLTGETNSFYGKTHTPDSKQKMSEIAKIRVVSEPSKAKISRAMAGINLSNEHKANISTAQPNSKKLLVLDVRTGKESLFDSVNQGEKFFNFPKDAIRANLRSKSGSLYRGIYKFQFIVN
uniref:GIY-YIG endonuclease n=1 Tax=Sclerotinia borealis TaxID=77105 RepID=A0A088CAE2_9HELO|nr:GIY-YIG endonuclease [Sclerotinia borealis]AHX82984.1 GIY-YIG endonuclease [Sclerotinia borealis]